ncbi:MAG: acyltransferase [Promethearchaeota archaeon]
MTSKKIKIIFRRLFTSILQDISFFAPWPVRSYLHRARGTKIGKNVFIGSLVILEEVYPEHITIEDNVQISAGAKIVAHDSSFKNVFHGHIPTYIAPVILRRNAYIGSGAIILPGVTVGESAIVGAGALVISDIPPRTIAVGVPAKVVGTIEKSLERFLSKRGLFLWKYYEEPRELTESEIAEAKTCMQEDGDA